MDDQEKLAFVIKGMEELGKQLEEVKSRLTAIQTEYDHTYTSEEILAKLVLIYHKYIHNPASVDRNDNAFCSRHVGSPHITQNHLVNYCHKILEEK